MSIIEVKNVGKKFNIVHQRGRYVALRDVIFNVLRSPLAFLRTKVKQATGIEKREEFWALTDINFNVGKGEVVGIIGHNGAGKSTLLKILSQITPPSTGEVVLHGRVGSLLEVGTGFHPELTGRENVFLNGAILGMRRSEIAAKFDDIVEFAGIEKFLDTPVKHYSSGMYVRLAFSVAAHMEPDILLVDEVLAVGDAEFQKKCLGKMDEITKKEGRTILFVSHNMGAIQNLCHRTILLKNGRIEAIGATEEIINLYIKDLTAKSTSNIADRKDRRGTGDLRITDSYLVDSEGNRVNSGISGKDLTIALEYETRQGVEIRNPVIGMSITTRRGENVFLCQTEMTGTDFGTVKGKGIFKCHIRNIPLVPNTYMISVRIASGGDELDYLENMTSLEILDGNYYGTGSNIRHSLVYVDHEWKIEKR